MKKLLPLFLLVVAMSFTNCASIGKDNVSIHPTIKTETQNILTRPTEFTIELDTEKWVEGESYKGSELFGISFFENRFVPPTLLNKEGHDAYTLDAIHSAIQKEKSDAFHLVKAEEELFAFPFSFLAIYKTKQTRVKGHPIKFKFLGPISEEKADSIYAAGLSKTMHAVDPKTPLYPAKTVNPPATCCK